MAGRSLSTRSFERAAPSRRLAECGSRPIRSSGASPGLIDMRRLVAYNDKQDIPGGKAMGALSEKRCEDRQNCDAEVEWAYFNKADFFNARLLNFSGGGSYMESAQPLIPGATILIRLQPRAALADKPPIRNMRTTALGEVKWCRELHAEPSHRFGIGVRYHIPV
jgi:hypothetical protein